MSINPTTIAKFLNNEIGAEALPEPAWGPIGKEVYQRTYSRDGEVWAETVRRVVLGSMSYTDEKVWLDDEPVKLFSLLYEFKAIPAGRHLWVTGTPVSTLSKNCFAYETEVLTKQGVRLIGDIVGEEVEILDGNGAWVKSTAKNFGQQRLMELVVKRGTNTKSIFATADHGWFVRHQGRIVDGQRTHRIETSSLKSGNRLETRVARAALGKTHPSPVGIQHGFVFGDGNLTHSGGANANFCGDKDMAMVKWFPAHRLQSKKDGVFVAPDNPRAWKSLPDITEATSYLYGWLAGYFAADGSVHSTGGAMTLSSSVRGNLDFVRDVCYRLGIQTHPVTVQHRSGFGNDDTPLYSVSFSASSFTEDFFLIPAHLESWKNLSSHNTDRKTWWTVESVQESDRFEDVYCFEVPTTHSFVLAENILTSNCWAVGFGKDTYSHFQFLAERLFEGGGVGANYSDDMTNVTNPIRSTASVYFRLNDRHKDYAEVAEITPLNTPVPADAVVVRVPDTREGWVSTWVTLFATVCRSSKHTNLVIDINDIRPYGAPLKTFGGTASGPAALVRSLIAINEVLTGAVGDRLSGLDTMRIDHEIACAVVAGGARRSARMSIMSWRDAEVMDFINAKADSGSHWTTNISVEIDSEFRDAIADPTHPSHVRAQEILDAVTAGMASNGEPGLIDTELASLDEPNPVRITNPCGEVFLESVDSELGVIGESCNLGSVDLDAFGTDTEGAHEAFALMARFLYRATLNPHKDPRANRIEETSRRIGVGFMGLQGWAAAHGVKLSGLATSEELLDALNGFRQSVRNAADSLADELGTPKSVKVTAIAPTGTIAQLRGTQPGIHPVFARHFLRRVRYANSDPQLVELAASGYHIEPDLYTAQTSVVEYVVRDSILDRFGADLIEQSDEINLHQFLGLMGAIQSTFCGFGDGNSISATAQIAPDTDPKELSNALVGFLGKVKGVTVFPAISRPQSPYEAISEAQYESNAGPVQMVGDSNSGECVGSSCPIR